MKYLIILPFIVSCSVFQFSRLSKNVIKESKKVCLNADGNGRLKIQGHKYVFSFETLLNVEESKWQMALSFPLHGEEYIELNLDEGHAQLNQKLEDKILKERSGVNPELLHNFMSSWGVFLRELIYMQQNEREVSDAKFRWNVSKNKLSALSKQGKNNISSQFYNARDSFFTRMDFLLRSEVEKRPMQIELVVRKCLN